MRAIDADDLKSELKFPDERLNRVFACMIDNSPTIDLVERAEWKWEYDGMYDRNWKCSGCNKIPPHQRCTRYCPHCGAKMINYENR
jgi:rubrerythrin